ncbi:MAG: tetratricopeptide repeat protein [Anaerolineae bacterium]|nr:tetratricopeptide repeat protein [Anaerolineae bacterium]
MYLKSNRDLFRRRHSFRWLRILLVLVLLGGGAYLLYRQLANFVTPFTEAPIPTPMPTATPGPGYYASQGADAYLDGATGAAIEAYLLALDMEPNQTELYLELARMLVYYGQPERGLEMARQALIRQPESAEAWALLGRSYDWLGLPNRAIEYCEKAIELDPTLPEAYAYLAEAYIDSGNWYAANETIATAMALDATNTEVLRNQAYVLENQGNYSAAIAGYEEALQVNDRLVHLYLAIGRNAGALGNLLRARNAFEEAVSIDPNHALALDKLGWTQLLLGDYNGAKTNLQAALELDPTITDVYGHLGTLYFHQRNYEDAIEMFKPAIAYGEARPRRQTVLFVITAEESSSVGIEPQGPEVAMAAFVHPSEVETPMRGEFRAADGTQSVSGRIRFDVMTGRYEFFLRGLPPAPSGRVYVGWFLRLLTPEGNLIRTEPIFPATNGEARMTGATGVVKGPPIENYYNYALCHYLLDQCSEAIPLIQTALRIGPDDENARRTLELCQ